MELSMMQSQNSATAAVRVIYVISYMLATRGFRPLSRRDSWLGELEKAVCDTRAIHVFMSRIKEEHSVRLGKISAA